MDEGITVKLQQSGHQLLQFLSDFGLMTNFGHQQDGCSCLPPWLGVGGVSGLAIPLTSIRNMCALSKSEAEWDGISRWDVCQYTEMQP